MTRVNIVKLVNIVKIVQNWCLGQGSPLPCSCYRPAAGATLQGLCRKGYADDDADDDKDDDDDGDDMMLLIYSLKVVGAQRGSVLNFLFPPSIEGGPVFLPKDPHPHTHTHPHTYTHHASQIL